VSRSSELAALDGYLDLALLAQGHVIFTTGEAGSGKTALIGEFVRRAQDAHADLVVASGSCNAHTGFGDPYLPFREVLALLTGAVETRWAAGAVTSDHARRLWNTLPVAAQALLEAGPDLLDTFLPSAALLSRAEAYTQRRRGAGWLRRLERVVELRDLRQDPEMPISAAAAAPRQSDLLEQ
jgi:predicted ATPase